MGIATTAGIGFRPVHADDVFDVSPAGLWLEVHPENYLVEGGPRLALLEALAARFPLSFHGVSMSLAGADAPDRAHLMRLRRLVDRMSPVLVSEHLAWSSWGGRYLPDLLPFPRTHEALARVVDNVTRAQDALGRRISLENPSHYRLLEGHDWSETDFLGELARRSGCGLLLDLNNVVVTAHNLGTDAHDYIGTFPLHAVTEIHLAGHQVDSGPDALLIDSHDSAIAPVVWQLFDDMLARSGPIPTLIERDGNIPALAGLLDERAMAQARLNHAKGMRHAAG